MHQDRPLESFWQVREANGYRYLARCLLLTFYSLLYTLVLPIVCGLLSTCYCLLYIAYWYYVLPTGAAYCLLFLAYCLLPIV